MAGRGAFKVNLPSGVNRNVTEAKVMQKGREVWVQLPVNTVVDKKFGETTYAQDYNRISHVPAKLRHVKAKVKTRHQRSQSEECVANCTRSKINIDTCRPHCKNYVDGIPTLSRYSAMKTRKNQSGHAFLPVMMNGNKGHNGLSMTDHYVPSRKMISSRGNPPDNSEWSDISHIYDVHKRNHSGKINHGDDFLENPYTQSWHMNERGCSGKLDRSVSFRPRTRSAPVIKDLHHTSTVALATQDFGVTTSPVPKLNHQEKRHDLEILTRVDPQSLGGHTEPYDNGNGAIFTSSGHNNGSFTIAPDWVSERKKSVVLPY